MTRTWLITGADKGLGASAARSALEFGDNVVVTVLDEDAKHSLSVEYPSTFRSIHLNAAHVLRVPEVVAEAEAAFGPLDILLNNAGYGLCGIVEETPAEKYRPLFEVNFFGLVEMTRWVLPIMRRQRSGRIINISSTAGFGGVAGFSFYAASKFAVEGFSESLAKEVRDLGIKVTIVEPAPFRSDFAGASLDNADCKIPEYGKVAEFVTRYGTHRARHGSQMNDPAKFGPAMLQLAAAESPPVRLPLGIEAVAHVRDEMSAVEHEISNWAELSASTGYDP